jgi:UDP-N-acetylmuramoylalanine--D-glutamate ligase
MKDRHFVVMGLARQGRSLARYLAAHGARVTVTDAKTGLDTSEFAGMPAVRFVLGDHPLSLLDDCDALALSGGIPTDLPIVLEAQRRGIPLTNDAQIFMEHCPATVVGITGSAGKTTTTTLAHRMLAATPRKVGCVYVGGNIGNPLVDDVDAMRNHDTVVMELSSFQLDHMTVSPQIACITNLTPNHLDRHPSMEAYVEAKRNILNFQLPEHRAVLNRTDAAWYARKPAAQIAWISASQPPTGDGAWLDAGHLRMRAHGHEEKIAHRDDLRLMGEHNALNILAASLLASYAGASIEAVRDVALNFSGVPHRLELVRERNGVRWYNDSIATAPERLIAGLKCFSRPVVLLVGGRDKHLPWAEAVEHMAARCRRVVLFGELAPLVEEAINRHGAAIAHTRVAGLEQAVATASNHATTGDVVLLSPGGTSFDQFKDFAERGDKFREWVNQL